MTTRLAHTTDNDWRWAVPEDWCYACGMRSCHGDPDLHAFVADPESTQQAIRTAVLHAVREVGAPDLVRDWHPAHVDVARRLVAKLQDRIEWAEQLIARAAENR